MTWFFKKTSTSPNGNTEDGTGEFDCSNDGLMVRGPVDGTEIVDIVFVHGLTGDALDTWSAEKGKFWPTKLLQPNLKSVRILSFGYNSAIVSLKGGVSKNTLYQHAQALATRLDLFRGEDGTSKRPLIFVCHSLGGLLVECVVSDMLPKKFSYIKEVTYGIAFFSTPHAGSSKADYAKKLAILAKPFNNNTQLLSALGQESEILFAIENKFHDIIIDKNPWEIISFYEEFEYRQFGKIVADGSSIIKGKDAIGIQANHVTMTKFSHHRSNGYEDVRLVLNKWTNGIRERQESILHLKVEELKSINAQAEESVRNERELVEKETRDGLRKILASANQHDVEVDLEQALEKRCDKTMDWIFSDAEYQWWINASHNAALWVNGSFGVGKSTLCSKIISKFRNDQRIPEKAKHVAFFFCKSQDNCAVLSSLAIQLLAMQTHMTSDQTKMFKQWERCGVPINPEKRVTDILELIKMTLYNLFEVYIIVDGLDEHPEPVAILKRLETLYNYCPGVLRKTKWIFTSRVTQDIKVVFQGFLELRELRMNEHRSSRIDQDIATFAASELSEKLRTAEINIDKFINTIVEKSEGCFLYASLLVNQIKSKITWKEIFDSLEQGWGKGYEGLQNLYNAAWDRCTEKACIGENFKLLLTLVVFSMKPLRLSELEDAFQADRDSSDNTIIPFLRHEINKPIKGALQNLCGPFVDTSGSENDPIFLLTHSKVKDYVLDRQDFFTKTTGNKRLGELCLKYLKSSSFLSPRSAEELQDPKFQQEHAFLKYASIFWYKHLEPIELNDVTEGLFKETYRFWRSKNFRTCIQMQSLYAPYHFSQFVGESLFSSEHEISYADALPGWFGTYNDQGRAAAYTYFRFVKEWGYYLKSHPGRLEGCIIGLIGDEDFCGGIAKEESSSVLLGKELILYENRAIKTKEPNGQVDSMQKPTRTIICIGQELGILVVSCLLPPKIDELSNKNTCLVLTQWSLGSAQQPSLSGARVFEVDIDSSMSIRSDISCKEHQTSCISTRPLISGCAETIVLMIRDRVCSFSISSKRNSNHRFRDGLLKYLQHKSHPALAKFTKDNSVIRLATYGNVLAVARRWECTKQDLAHISRASTTSLTDVDVEELEKMLKECKDEVKAVFTEAIQKAIKKIQRQRRSRDGASGPEAPSADRSSPSFSSEDSDNDNESDDDDTGQVAAGKEVESVPICYKLTIYDTKKKKTRKEATFHASNIGIGLPGTPVLHPQQKLVAWYAGSGRVVLMSYATTDRNFEQFDLSADVKPDEEKIISCDIRFSPDGDYLHTASICCKTEHCSAGVLIVTSRKLSSPQKHGSLLDGKAILSSTSVPWKLSQPSRRFLRPYCLLHAFTWATDTVYVSFSNLTLSVLKVALPMAKSAPKQSWTLHLMQTMYLPASAREVCFRYHPIRDNSAYLVPEYGNFDPPAVILVENFNWEEVGQEGVDFTPAEERKLFEFYEASEESFSIPVRSGCEWTDRKVLNCWT
ncbi:MAG: hypothetical protein M1834_001208 [Cirrosporium novae-zelandiae]|nr:MAG: hypothetical protein M1834_001208 [Cirrosporium novae-zelandiae]